MLEKKRTKPSLILDTVYYTIANYINAALRFKRLHFNVQYIQK